MVNRYNLDNFEALFKEYLLAGNEKMTKKALSPISIKNYLSDMRHFFGWLIFYLKAKNFDFSLFSSPIDLLKQVKQETVAHYRTYLLENNIPIKTINRRLSSLRKFFSFSIEQKWLEENPVKHISNIKPKETTIEQIQESSQERNEKILSLFQQDLQKDNLDEQFIKSCLADVREFLGMIEKHGQGGG